MDSIYHVGDRVRVVPSLKAIDSIIDRMGLSPFYGGDIPGMCEMEGQLVTISYALRSEDKTGFEENGYVYNVEGCQWTWSAEYFEPLASVPEYVNDNVEDLF